MVCHGNDKDRWGRQALELFQRAGISCVTYRGAARAVLRVEDNLTAKHAGMRCYFRSRTLVHKVLHELCNTVSHERIGDRVRLVIAAAEVDQLIHDCAARIGARSMGSDQFEQLLRHWSRTLEDALDRLRLSGALQGLNHKYRELRLSGTKMPPYDTWLGAQISADIDAAKLGF